MKRCGKCGSTAIRQGELADGLPGILYWICGGCGWTRAINKPARRERIGKDGKIK